MANRSLAYRIARGTGRVLGNGTIYFCVIVFLPFYGAAKGTIKCYKCLKRRSAQGRRVYLASETTHPIPLPPQRQFNLSNPDIPLVEQPSQSRLMQLPYTVRLRIWEFAIGHRLVGIKHKPGARHLTNVSSDAIFNYHPELQFVTWRFEADVLDNSCLCNRHQGMKAIGNFALLRTCRQVYQECIPILYRSNRFYFNQASSISFFAHSIRYQHLALIRELMIIITGRELKVPGDTDWRTACAVMSTRMKGLTNLIVDVRGITHNWERALFDPLKRISGLENFSLNLEYINYWVTVAPDMDKQIQFVIDLAKRPRGAPADTYARYLREREAKKGRPIMPLSYDL